MGGRVHHRFFVKLSRHKKMSSMRTGCVCMQIMMCCWHGIFFMFLWIDYLLSVHGKHFHANIYPKLWTFWQKKGGRGVGGSIVYYCYRSRVWEILLLGEWYTMRRAWSPCQEVGGSVVPPNSRISIAHTSLLMIKITTRRTWPSISENPKNTPHPPPPP